MIYKFNNFTNENINSEYEYLISLLNKIKKQANSFNDFKTIIEYYGVRNKEMINIKNLINTERVSGREIKTTGPINVIEDIRNGKLYIIDGHNRVQYAKNNNQEKIEAVVSKGYFIKKGNYFDPEVNILVQKYNINLEDFYNGKITESLLDKLEGPTWDEVFDNTNSFHFKINSNKEFNNYLNYFDEKRLLGNKITIGTYMGDYIFYNYGETTYNPIYYKEFNISIEPLEFANNYKNSFGKYNILVSIVTPSDISNGDVSKLEVEDKTKIEYCIDRLINKAERIYDWSRDEEFGYENDEELSESLLDKISGPTNDDVLNDAMKRLNIIDLDRTNAEKLLQYGIGRKIPYIIKYVSEKFNIFNQSGLYVLMMNNDIEYVEKYFKKGFRFKFLNQYGDFAYRTPLYDALKTSPEMFKLIYKYHKEISKKILNELLIENYSFVHDLSYFDVLFELGADVHFNNDSMIKKMIEYRKIKIIKQLLERFDFSRNTIVFCIELAHRTSKSQIEAVFTDYKNNKYL